MEYNLLKTCRSCLKSFTKLNNLFVTYLDTETDRITLAECYELCSNLKLNVNDDLPKMICVMCETTLKAAFYFRIQCAEAIIYFKDNCKNPTEIIVPPKDDGPPLIVKVERIAEQPEENGKIIIDNEDERPIIVNIEEMNLEKSIDNMPLPPIELIGEFKNETNVVVVTEALPKLSSPSPDRMVTKDPCYFQCSKCRKTFISERHLIIHMKTHTNTNVYVCNICNRKCPSKSVLKIHQKKHKTPGTGNQIVQVKNESSKEGYVIEYLY